MSVFHSSLFEKLECIGRGVSENVIFKLQGFQLVRISAQDSAAMHATFCKAESNFF